MFNGRAPTHLSVINYRADILKILLDNGSSINQRDSQGNTVLHLASMQTQDKVVKFLLDRGAEVDAENIWKETPLQKAAEIGSVTIFEILLEAGADLNHKDKIQRTPLDWVKLQSHDSIFDLLKKREEAKKEAEREQNLLALSDASGSSASFNASTASFVDGITRPPLNNLNSKIIQQSIQEDL